MFHFSASIWELSFTTVELFNSQKTEGLPRNEREYYARYLYFFRLIRSPHKTPKRKGCLYSMIGALQ